MTENKLKAHEVAKMYGNSERSLWRNLRWAADVEILKEAVPEREGGHKWPSRTKLAATGEPA